MMFRFHTQTGGSTLSASQIDNNVVRTTIQALSAILGGTQSLHTNSRDEALALPSDEAAKLALRTQQIIAYESGIPNHPDPFGGSFIIEEMTSNFVEGSMKIIEKIDSMGGAVAAIENGYMANEISRSSYEYQKEIESNKKIVVGVNKFEDQKEIEPNLLVIDPVRVKSQIDSLTSLKSSRNNDQVQTVLGKLKSVAVNEENVMPAIIKCVKNDCTLGEIADTLRSVFGEY
jgi:methylmalonyl-CoA mutase N-terminal domain/subunit